MEEDEFPKIELEVIKECPVCGNKIKKNKKEFYFNEETIIVEIIHCSKCKADYCENPILFKCLREVYKIK